MTQEFCFCSDSSFHLRDPLSVLFPQCVFPPSVHSHPLSPHPCPSKFHVPICLSNPTSRYMYRLCPKPPQWAIAFPGDSNHWLITSFSPQFPKQSYFTLVSTQISVSLGHRARKQTPNGEFPPQFPNNFSLPIPLLLPNLQKFGRK